MTAEKSPGSDDTNVLVYAFDKSGSPGGPKHRIQWITLEIAFALILGQTLWE